MDLFAGFAGMEDRIMDWFMAYAYQPEVLLPVAALLMLATCFGLPLPEEFIIIALGLCAHIGSRPDLYPPPEGALGHVTTFSAILAGLGAVLVGDLIVFSVGRYVGKHPGRRKWVDRIINQSNFERISTWMKKYGFWTAGIFRFTPGLRLPGHFSCGMFGVPAVRFILVDGTAALVSIPTQIALISFYGDTILEILKKMKVYVAYGALIFVVVFAVYLFIKRRRALKARLKDVA